MTLITMNIFNSKGSGTLIGDNNSFFLTPALGDSWSHACSTRIIMDFCNKSVLEEVVSSDEKGRQLLKSLVLQNEPFHKYKFLSMLKSPKHSTPTKPAILRVTSEGIRDAF